MKIDIFPHILPPKYKEALSKYTRAEVDLLLSSVPTLTDLDLRFRIMDKHPDVVQVLTLAQPAVEAVAGPKETADLAMMANDEMAELVAKYPDRFVAAVATLPMNDIDAALKEAERAIQELHFRGVMIYSSVNGKPLDSPELDPLYERMAKYNLPIWIHPRKDVGGDYPGEERSLYYMWVVWGWPYETTLAMTRLVIGGVLEKHPQLKFMIHHCGAMVPAFEGRIASTYDYAEMRLGRKYKRHLTKPPLDYFRMFYTDTATYGSTPALMCGYAFFGADHLLFGTDTPFDSQLGDRSTRETIRAIERMAIPEVERQRIFEYNARSLLRLPV